MTEIPLEAVERAALAAVERVGGGDSLRADVLARLRSPDGGTHRYLDLISLTSLIVTAATSGWVIVQDLRSRGAERRREVVTRRIRIELAGDGTVSAAERDAVIEAVVEQIVREDTGQEGDRGQSGAGQLP
ncbi:hypothetical protein [Streptomyces wuyuanensis]|uniref:Uncharacterized protein n=1 Tax=Streptomyces wuyuanensis TaxID=1196353 RepID=A0A1G9YLL3_9ACTN|nr:hypothetical protein [Streptomyces wuyuanensis]SDN10068.1 hypothetical protein SAMN05444921_11915 [Streptomyces wuyuanensis]